MLDFFFLLLWCCFILFLLSRLEQQRAVLLSVSSDCAGVSLIVNRLVLRFDGGAIACIPSRARNQCCADVFDWSRSVELFNVVFYSVDRAPLMFVWNAVWNNNEESDNLLNRYFSGKKSRSITEDDVICDSKFDMTLIGFLKSQFTHFTKIQKNCCVIHRE